MVKNERKKTRKKCADITRYRNTYLILAHSLGCLRMLPLREVAFDDVERPWRRAKNCHTVVQNLTLTLYNKLIFVTNYCKFHSISEHLLNIGTLTWMPSHVAVAWRCFRWHRTSTTSREKIVTRLCRTWLLHYNKLIFVTNYCKWHKLFIAIS